MSAHRVSSSPDDRPAVVLRLTGRQHKALYDHLYPGDGKEAVALALCGRRLGEAGNGDWGSRHILTVNEVVPVPHEACHERTPSRVAWPTDAVMPALDKAARKGLAVVKVHSHPTGYMSFSEYDDESDRVLFPSIMGWVDDDGPHASAVMLPDDVMFARAMYTDTKGGTCVTPVKTITVAGDDLRFWHRDDEGLATQVDYMAHGFTDSHAQAFGTGTTAALRNLSVAVIGVSGTGSPIVEMLARLGVGELILV